MIDKQLSLKDVQKVSLDILREIHTFCNKNDINYSLAFGSMLGAVRHKGFIPWDDDIDVYMPRKDYERFSKIYRGETTGIVSYRSKKSYVPFTRVYDKVQTRADQTWFRWCKSEVGVYVDIFPLDGVPDSHSAFEKRKKKMGALRRFSNRFRSAASTSLKDSSSIKEYLKLLFLKFIFLNGSWFFLLNAYVNHLARSFEYGSTIHCAQMLFEIREWYDTEDFKSRSLVDFEGEKFYMADGYDHILKQEYGDYMKLPPVEERRNDSRFPFYWK